ncbi:hypothetical protein EES41_36510 [Streptomyces sp. ADI95-16]|uniref:hypothetical protein n=1 Tax=Streptomyces sp. ADI95-16 TaxID=1522758 RepID=UPI000F42D8A8|nr:hypothetical protein [Streptomyces sp. ADI95-16]AYV32263.1 hypothetical protein EES41_36510 [Streptomyces sp. ADI95-16]
MTLSTLYDFLRNDLLGNLLSTLLVTGAGYTAKKIRSRLASQNDDTDQPDS